MQTDSKVRPQWVASVRGIRLRDTIISVGNITAATSLCVADTTNAICLARYQLSLFCPTCETTSLEHKSGDRNGEHFRLH